MSRDPAQKKKKAGMSQATLTIDLDAIAANWRTLAAASGTAETAAVVKADAYGLGLAPVAKALLAAGARTFFVAQAHEGAALRNVLDPSQDIYVFGGYHPQDHDFIKDTGLIPLLNSPAQVTAFRDNLPGHPFGLQLDSGMNRLGIEPFELSGVLDVLSMADARLAMSHLACSDAPENTANEVQRASFASMCASLPNIPRSLAATGGIHLGSSYHFEMTRPGIGLYGGDPGKTEAVVTLSAPVLQTRDVQTGEAVGYGAGWIATRDSKISTVSIGYADGLFRGTHGARVFIDETPCPIVGRISMDLITIDATDLAEPPDAVTLIGPHQTIDDLAAAASTIGYEVLTALGPRHIRRYIGG